MRCVKCQTEIPPEWKAAIKSNICPACGGELMNDSMQELLRELSKALEAMPNDPEGIAGWLLSNYELRKIGTGEPVNEFYGSQRKVPQGKDLVVNENRIQQFLKQAGVKPKKTQADYASLAQQIRDGGTDYGEAFSDPSPEQPEEFVEEARDPEYTQQVLSAMTTGAPTKTSMGAAQPSSDLDNDMSGLHPALRQDRIHRLRQQLEVGSGGKAGVIRRK